jgi:hypothetical protein
MFGFHLDCLDSTGGETVGFLNKNGETSDLLGAGVVELADTGDLKSPAPQGVYGFKSRLRQVSQSEINQGIFPDFLFTLPIAAYSSASSPSLTRMFFRYDSTWNPARPIECT